MTRISGRVCAWMGGHSWVSTVGSFLTFPPESPVRSLIGQSTHTHLPALLIEVKRWQVQCTLLVRCCGSHQGPVSDRRKKALTALDIFGNKLCDAVSTQGSSTRFGSVNGSECG
jgi:hypothetical protein